MKLTETKNTINNELYTQLKNGKMKNVLFVLVAVGISALTGINRAKAQNQAAAGVSWQINNVMEIEKTIPSGKNKLIVPGDINPRALKDFAKKYKNVTDERWVYLKDNLSASFISDGVSNTIYYNSKGKWQGSLKRYHEDKLPFEIRDIVKSKYYDYTIFYVEEMEVIDSRGVPTYIIHLEDKNNVKLLRIFERQMEIWQEYKKW